MSPNSNGTRRPRRATLWGCIAFCTLLSVGCNWEMRDDSRLKPYEKSPVFADGQSSRPLVTGTVARDHLTTENEALYTGKQDGKLVTAIPMPLTKAMLERGRERYNIYCSVCHGLDGYGKGMIVQRGFPEPPSYHIDRLRRAPVGHIYEVISNGYGVMYSYADRITPEDRWAIAAYIRALQVSQYAKLEDVPVDQRSKMNEPAHGETHPTPAGGQPTGAERGGAH